MARKPPLVDDQTRTVDVDDRIQLNHTGAGVVVERHYSRSVFVDGKHDHSHHCRCVVPDEIAAFMPGRGSAQYDDLPAEAQQLIDAYTSFEVDQ